MQNENDVDGVRPEWQHAFRDFVSTGEVSEGFMQYLEEDPEAQGAVEKVFKEQAAAFEALAAELSPQRRSFLQRLVS